MVEKPRKSVPGHAAWLAGFGLFLAAQIGWAAEAPLAKSLETATAAYQVVPEEQQFDAVVEAVRQSTVSAQTSGRVAEVLYDVDDYVPRGAVIMRLKSPEQRSGVAAAQAARREAQARLDEAQAEHDRLKALFEQRLITRSQFDSAVATLRTAQERAQAAQARLEQAQEELGYTVIRAPFAGIVVKRHVEVGEFASAGQPLMTGFALNELRVTTTVPQSAADAIRQNKRARVILSVDDTRGVPASKVTLFPYADPVTHTFKVRIDLKQDQQGIYPGMLVKAVFVTGEERRLAVPVQAVARRGEVTAVYVIDPQGRVSLRQVRVGRHLPEDQHEILAGLEVDERVALDPVRAAVHVKEQQAGGK